MSKITPITFEVVSGSGAGRTETFEQDMIKIGTVPAMHFRLEDPNVSRMHAVVEVTAGGVFIIDLGSTSGTFLNGQKIGSKAQIQNGDELTLGETRVRVQYTAAVAARPAVPSVPPPPANPFAASNPFAAAAPAPNPFAASAAVPNPFAAAAPAPMAVGHSSGHGHDDEDEDPEKYTYALIASAPPVSADEVETSEQAAEVVLMWGERQILQVTHLSPIRTYVVGELGGTTDYLIGSETLGAASIAMAVPAGAGVAATIPPGATGSLTANGQTRKFSELGGMLQPSSEMPGAMQVVVPPGGTAKVEYRGFVFVTKPVAAGKKVGAKTKIDWEPFFYVGGAMGVFATLLIFMYFLPPAGGGLNLDLLNTDSRLIQVLMEPPATEEEEVPEFLDESQATDDSGGKGKRHKDEEGAMGKTEAKKTNNRFGIEGPQDNEDPHMAREAAQEMARNAGALGTLRAMMGSWNSPTSPYGADTALGNDPMSALGALMGDNIGENSGAGGLGLRGTGLGGGGTGEGTIGLGSIGTIGHGAGGGSGSGYGRGAGGLHGRSASVPTIRTGNAEVRGSLSREVIQRVVRRHQNEIKHCYEQELSARPDLQGRVTMRWIIAADGRVQTAMVAATDLRNQRVESCMTQAVQRWTFPAPDGGGIVIVNAYPFVLSSGG